MFKISDLKVKNKTKSQIIIINENLLLELLNFFRSVSRNSKQWKKKSIKYTLLKTLPKTSFI